MYYIYNQVYANNKTTKTNNRFLISLEQQILRAESREPRAFEYA